MISMAVTSSTYLTLLLYLAAIPFTRMQKSRKGGGGGASVGPCGSDIVCEDVQSACRLADLQDKQGHILVRFSDDIAVY